MGYKKKYLYLLKMKTTFLCSLFILLVLHSTFNTKSTTSNKNSNQLSAGQISSFEKSLTESNPVKRTLSAIKSTTNTNRNLRRIRYRRRIIRRKYYRRGRRVIRRRKVIRRKGNYKRSWFIRRKALYRKYISLYKRYISIRNRSYKAYRLMRKYRTNKTYRNRYYSLKKQRIAAYRIYRKAWYVYYRYRFRGGKKVVRKGGKKRVVRKRWSAKRQSLYRRWILIRSKYYKAWRYVRRHRNNKSLMRKAI